MAQQGRRDPRSHRPGRCHYVKQVCGERWERKRSLKEKPKGLWTIKWGGTGDTKVAGICLMWIACIAIWSHVMACLLLLLASGIYVRVHGLCYPKAMWMLLVWAAAWGYVVAQSLHTASPTPCWLQHSRKWGPHLVGQHSRNGPCGKYTGEQAPRNWVWESPPW